MKRANFLSIIFLSLMQISSVIAVSEEINTLCQASHDGDISKVQDIIYSQPDDDSRVKLVNTKDKTGNTPLIAACLGNKLSIVQFLIFWGADVNMKNEKEEHSPIYTAGNLLHSDIAKRLVSAGAKLDDPIGKYQETFNDILEEYKSSEFEEENDFASEFSILHLNLLAHKNKLTDL